MRERVENRADPTHIRPEVVGVLCAGSFVCDIVAAGLPQIGGPGDLIYAPHGISLSVGGHSANVSIDLVQLGQKKVAAAGCIGDDLFGDYLEGELGRRGVHVYLERLTDMGTAKNIALVVEGEDRRFYAELAANTMLSPGRVLSALDDVEPGVFFLGTVGGLRLIDRHLTEVLSEARSRRCLTFVDIIVPNGGSWEQLTEALPLIDVLHCNDRESAALTGTENQHEAADELLRRGVGFVLITMGSMGLLAYTERLKLQMPAFRVDAMDPTGAGDALCAGVIHALLDASTDRVRPPLEAEGPLKRVLLEGAAAGAACVTAPGATTAVTRPMVDRLIREQGEAVWSSASHL